MKAILRIAAIGSVLSTSATAGSPPVPSGGPFDPATAPQEGLHYYLAQDLIEVIATVNDQVLGTIELDGAGRPTVKRSTNRRTEADITIKTVADPGKTFILALSSRTMSDNTMTVELNEHGLLKSVNASSTGRAGDMLANILKTVATIASPSLAPGGAPVVPQPPPPSDCEVGKPPIVQMDKLARLTLHLSQNACTAWRRVEVADASAEVIRAQRRSAAAEIATASGKELEELQSKLKTYDEEVVANAKERSQYEAVITAEMARIKLENAIGGITTSKKVELVFGIDELPRAVGLNDKTKAEVDSALANHAKAKQFFDTTGVILGIDAQQPTGGADPSISDPGECELKFGATEVVNRCKSQLIFYRKPVTARVVAFALAPVPGSDGSGQPLSGKTKQADEWLRPLLLPNSPLEYLKLDAKRWAKGELQVAFDAKGVPTRVDWKSGSSAAAASGAVATALASARDEYATTVSKLVEIEENKKKLRPQEKTDLEKSIEEAKKKKELLDAQLALAGSQATYETVLSQQQATAQLALLQSEMSMVAAKEASANQIAVLRLEAEVTQVRKEVELLKAQLELAALAAK